MRIIYPYNEILPKKKAHDVFVVHECAAFADLSWQTTLLVGKGSKKEEIFNHYHIPFLNTLHIETKGIIRKNNPLSLSWNLPFFWKTQKYISKEKPDYVILSVIKQAAYHLRRKVAKTRYLYEVHELCSYPESPIENKELFSSEKFVLSHVDLITVTTSALKEILLKPPYSIKVPIAVVPLAVQAKPLPLSPSLKPITVMYVGQLYAEQGISKLLEAMIPLENIHLKIIGGREEEILELTQLAGKFGISEKVEFLGFIPPFKLPHLVQEAHAFVAPFENRGRMPYVAHTKLFEYSEWGRPIIAPDLPIVREHFDTGRGALLFEPDSIESLTNCLEALQQDHVRQKLQIEISSLAGRFSWPARASHYQQLLGCD